MKAKALTLRRLIWIIVVLFMVPSGILAQVAGEPGQADTFGKEELTQMLAPIALYPDALTAQVLMASTYPLEVVEAERWLQKNRDLKGADLDNALKEKEWEPSVKALCHFPDLLRSMSDKLDQTRKLGDAFLSQEEDVMATVQELRRTAREQGNLKTTHEQRVIVEEEYVRIEPANPEVIYVPVYDPYYVYGPWWYPAYPPYYWYYPPGFVSGAYIGFGPRIFIGFDLFSWVWFDWPFRRIHIDLHKTRHFHRHPVRRGGESNYWRHNPTHRKGVAYRDRRTVERFGSRPARIAPSRTEPRGYPAARSERQEMRSSQGSGDRRERGVESRPRNERDSFGGPEERRERSNVQRQRIDRESSQIRERQDSPFRGVGEGRFERRAVERGDRSIRGSEPFRGEGGSRSRELRSSGGGSRGGGSGGGRRSGGGGGGGGSGGGGGGGR